MRRWGAKRPTGARSLDITIYPDALRSFSVRFVPLEKPLPPSSFASSERVASVALDNRRDYSGRAYPLFTIDTPEPTGDPPVS